MKRIITTIAAMLICLALAWIAAFDFDGRGVTAFTVAFITLSAGVLAWIYPGWSE